MASSGNFSTLNPLDNPLSDSSSNTPSNGNLKFTSSGNCTAVSTIGLTFKAYAEVRIESISNYGGEIGLGGGTESNVFYKDNIYFQTNYQSGKAYHYKDGTNQAGSINIGGTVSAGDIIMMCWDPDTFKWWVGVNGTWRNSGDPANGTGFIYQYNSGSGDLWGNNQSNNNSRWSNVCSSANGLTCTWNFGQDSTFGGAVTAGGNADGNGFGDFKYTPPTGFLATCSGNMVISSDIDPGQTDDDIPQKQFGILTYTGNSTTGQSLTGLGFKPDLIWCKMFSYSQNNQLYDSSRLNSRNTPFMLRSDTNGAEADDQSTGNNNEIISSFDTDGFTLGGSGSGPNDNGREYVAWCWKANGGVTSSNTNGDITTTVQANQKAGFSIFTYTGNGGGAGTSMGHGLSKAPDIWFLKQRSNNGESSQKNWRVMLNTGTGGAFHSLNGSNQTLVLNEADAAAGLYRNDGNFNPTATVVQAPDNGNANSFFVVSGNTYVSYCWHSVEGYSKFGSYIGNGNDDGPFIYTGFKPKLVAIKWLTGVNSAENWGVFDTARSTTNPSSNGTYSQLQWDTSGAGSNTSSHKIDFLASGFKLRGNGGLNNTSGATYIFMCWGDVPLKYNNTF